MTLDEILKVHEQARLDISTASEAAHLAQDRLREATARWVVSMEAIDRHLSCKACSAGVGQDCEWGDSSMLSHIVHASRQRAARTIAGVM